MIASRGSVGTVGGVMNLSNQLSGIAAPIITGYVVAETRSYAWAFGISAIYLLLGIDSYIFLLGRIELVAPEPAFAHQ
jgi:ACS family D-galactonate transporter-like MFS transporter